MSKEIWFFLEVCVKLVINNYYIFKDWKINFFLLSCGFFGIFLVIIGWVINYLCKLVVVKYILVREFIGLNFNGLFVFLIY